MFLDDDGVPLANGEVYFYVPNTFTPKNTWQDAAGTILNTNPVQLDPAGRAIIYGSGSYRQIVKDSLGNTIWDQETSDTAPATGITWGGTSGGSANAQTVVAADFTETAWSKLMFIAGFTNTGAATVNPNGAGAIAVVKPSLTAPVALTGGEIVAGNLVELDYDGSQFQIVNPVETPVAGPTTSLSSASPSLGTVASHNVLITGTTAITSFGSAASTSFPIYFLRFEGALTLTHNATSLIIPGGQSITTAAGDTAIAEYLGSGNWRVRSYSPANPQWSPQPQGRLTLTTGEPVMTADVTTSGSVFYTPYVGNQVPIYNGSTFTPTTFSQLTLTLNNPNHLADTNYDVFIAYNSTTLTACTGPAWSSSTARGTGAATTQISRVLGLWTNTVSMTCRNGATTFTVAAGYGTYVGTIRTSGSAGDTVWVAAPAAAAGGGNARLYVWNAYQRVAVSATSKDSTNSWTYTTLTWRSANNSTSNRVTAIFGLNEDSVTATYSVPSSSAVNDSTSYVGVGLDSTSAFSGVTGEAKPAPTDDAWTATGRYNGLPGLGLHFFQALEASEASGTKTWYGDSNLPTFSQMGLTLDARM